MAISLRHVGIVVTNLDKAINLYTNYLGLTLKGKYDGLKGEYQDKLVGINNVNMRAAILTIDDNNRIELLEYTSSCGKKRKPVLSNDVGASHFALSVENINDLYMKREQFEVEFISKPIMSPDGYVKVAYAILMQECIVELVEVLDEKARYSGGE